MPRLFESFRRICGNEVAELARRTFSGEPVTRGESARVYAAFGPQVPDEDDLARTIVNRELNTLGMELTRQLNMVDQLGRIDCPTLVCVGALDPVTPVSAAQEIVKRCRIGSHDSRYSTERATSPGMTSRIGTGRS